MAKKSRNRETIIIPMDLARLLVAEPNEIDLSKASYADVQNLARTLLKLLMKVDEDS